MQTFETFESPFILLDSQNIDTDQIVPARFLKLTDKEGLGNALFYDWRNDETGQKKSDQILNQKEEDGIRILVADANFGCGSSREHAVWALVAYGFRVVISPSIGDIFKSNALKNGLLPIEVDEAFYRSLRETPDALLRVDLRERSLGILEGPTFSFPIDPFARHCLLQGLDQLSYLLLHTADAEAFEARTAV